MQGDVISHTNYISSYTLDRRRTGLSDHGTGKLMNGTNKNSIKAEDEAATLTMQQR